MKKEFTDRYEALGIRYPNPKTVCKGQCEGTGWVPVKLPDATSGNWEKWKEAHIRAGQHECDGWHFVVCPDCLGSGKKRGVGK